MAEKGREDLLEEVEEVETPEELDMFDIVTGAFLMLTSNVGCWTVLALDVPCYRLYVFAFYWLWAIKNRWLGPIWIDGGACSFSFGVSAWRERGWASYLQMVLSLGGPQTRSSKAPALRSTFTACRLLQQEASASASPPLPLTSPHLTSPYLTSPHS